MSPYAVAMPMIPSSLCMSLLLAACHGQEVVSQPESWEVHDMERPQPPRVEDAQCAVAKAPPGAKVLFDGSDASVWFHEDGSDVKWQVQDGQMVVRGGTGKIQTRETFGDVHLHVEWMVPESEAKDEGQARGNSGVFLMGLYEVQVLESGGSQTYADGMAASLYGQAPPDFNASAGIGKWNSYDIFFRAPSFKDEKMERPARITVLHNGRAVHQDRVLLGITRHKVKTQYHLHADRLPIALQDHGDPVHYRNIWIRELGDWQGPLGESQRARLKRHVQFLANQNPPRRHDQPASTLLSAEYIAEHMRRAGLAVHFQEFLVEGRMHRNVIGRHGGQDGPVLVVGAHYDSCSDTPGADDNASGVAGLLELARRVGSSRLRQDIEFVAFALEEPPYFDTPHMGSVAHARSLKESGRQVRGMIGLEMIGYFSDRPDSQRYPIAGMSKTYPTTADFIAVVSRPEDQEWMTTFAASMSGATPLGVQSLAAPSVVTGVDFSDHRSYWAQGFPALMITDTAFFRNPHYHEATDTPETLDYMRMAQVVDGVLAALAP